MNRVYIIGVICLFSLWGTGCGRQAKKSTPFVYFTNYSRTFNDLNDKHLSAARRLGITPMIAGEKVEQVRRSLKKITSCGDYQVDKLTHSIPYLVPEAADLLEQIAENFKDSLEAKGLPECSLIVTSLLRTDASVSKLRKKNVNASANSAHRYGTTFDIAYARYRQEDAETSSRDKLKTVLAEVLRDLRKQQKCYVRYEYKQGCFHITVR